MVDLDRAAIIRTQAAKLGVSSAVHSEDHIFNFLINHPGFDSDMARVGYYFEDGKRSSDKFRKLIAAHAPKQDKHTVLEFAAGYGCVSRHLLHGKEIAVESCDIHDQAIGFLQKEIGVRALSSSPFPEMLTLPSQYDVVFALSFFSHMPITTWARWQVALAKATRSGGLLIFTTHGLRSKPFFQDPTIPENGFWFQKSSEQADLSTEQYGQTIVTPEFCKANIASIEGLELIEMREGYWWDHQDLYVVRKRAPDLLQKGRARSFFSRVRSATTSFNAWASRRRSFTSSEVAAYPLSPASRFSPDASGTLDGDFASGFHVRHKAGLLAAHEKRRNAKSGFSEELHVCIY